MSINVVMVPVTPEQPKTVSNQQLFVYVNKNVTGGRYYTGNLLTGTSASFTSSAIPNAVIGDVYLNTSDTIYRGNIYTCIASAVNGVATWSYSGNTSVVKHNYIVSADVNQILQPYTQYAVDGTIYGSNNVFITIPQSFQGYIAEIDFALDAAWTGTFKITNNSGKTLIFMRDGMVLQTYIPAKGCKTNLLFRDNGIDMLCVIVELK